MAQHRPNVPPKLKQQLVTEAGNKCANPGCAAFRAHLHHIQEWAVYRRHDGNQMIAICPSCHDAVHNGPLEITDDTLRRWKRLPRRAVPQDHVYIEPGEETGLLLGSFVVRGPRGVRVFELGPSTRLSFGVEDEDIMSLNLAVSTTAGDEILRVVDNHVRRDVDDLVEYTKVPGHVVVSAPVDDAYIPEWALPMLREKASSFIAGERFNILDLEVMEPGLVRVEGLWSGTNQAISITPDGVTFMPRSLGPITLAGGGPTTILQYVGPIDTNLFGFTSSPGALTIPAQPVGVAPPGRNDPCWCGSGRKFKKCHGA
jgi:hypothetical protein